MIAVPSQQLQLKRVYEQEHAIRVAAFWTAASRRALHWSKRWEWQYAPSFVWLGEDILAIIAYADCTSILSLASTCRCLRSLLIPRLLEKKRCAVRNLYLCGGLH